MAPRELNLSADLPVAASEKAARLITCFHLREGAVSAVACEFIGGLDLGSLERAARDLNMFANNCCGGQIMAFEGKSPQSRGLGSHPH